MAAPKLTVGELILLPALVRNAADTGNVELLVFDEVIHVRKDDLTNWAVTVSGPGGAGAGQNHTAPTAAGFPTTSVFNPGRNPRDEWRLAQIAAGKKTA